MKTTMNFLRLLFLAATIIGSGCSMTNQLKDMIDLHKRAGEGPIRVLTVDSLLYTFNTFSFSDSLISGSGSLKQHGMTTAFNGSIPFTRIVFVEGVDDSYWKMVWVFPMAVGIVAGLSLIIGQERNFSISRSSDGSSCPYVYAFDGKQFQLEAEAFGTSISKVLEAKTFSLLPSLIPVDGRLCVRVANERPETHLLNSTHLFVADAKNISTYVLDVDNILWPLPHAIPPIAARDHSGKNIISDIDKKDKHFWKSDLAHTAPFSGFRDNVEVEFQLPEGASEATLVIDAINTELITEVYRSVGSLLGDATMPFYYALERDPELQSSIRQWIRDCNLRVEVKIGDDWKEVGMMPPEANATPFSRAIRIENLGGLHGLLRARLSSLTDVWRIDAVSIDFSPVKPLPLHPLEIISANTSDHQDKANVIESADSSYALILPNNFIDISYNAAPAQRMQKPIFVFAAQGYLYEWFPTHTETVSSFIPVTLTSDDRIGMLKLLITQRDLFLPPIYANWRIAAERNHGR